MCPEALTDSMPEPSDLSAILRAAREGDDEAMDQLFSLLYDELKSLARAQRQKWEGDYTLNATALVHEAYLKLVRPGRSGWEDRAHFLGVASKAMRHILVNYAERRRAQKRGGDGEPIPLEPSNPVAPGGEDGILALHEALDRLAGMDERQSQVVECRFFGGLTIRETASVLSVSTATVERDWVVASAWLRRELDQGEERETLLS
jgi:RNA polymerase sigma factor (TIGR02999 family)